MFSMFQSGRVPDLVRDQVGFLLGPPSGFQWVLLTLTWFYWVLMGFTGFFCWVLVDFNGFY